MASSLPVSEAGYCCCCRLQVLQPGVPGGQLEGRTQGGMQAPAGSGCAVIWFCSVLSLVTADSQCKVSVAKKPVFHFS
jgi:hypothetical protein